MAGRVRLAVCADDYGLSEGVDEAIAQLVAAGRLSAFSCLVDAPHFRPGAAAAAQLARRADVGLHLNFTERFGAEAPRFGLGTLVARAYAGLLDAAAIRTEIARQLDAFEDACGLAPHHVDGHQHVQQLPCVRRELLAELARRYPARRPWLRIGTPPAGGRGLKPAVLGALGARALASAAQRGGFATNAHLLGVYDFGGSAAGYVARLDRWLAQARERDLLMTHPGARAARGDPIAAAREREYGVLAGAEFARLLSARGVEVARLSAL